MKAEDYKVTVEPGNFIDNFLEQAIGLKVGDEKEIFVKFPEDYGAQDLAGKAAKFAIKIKGIFKPELPALDDELAKKNKSPKAETLEELKTKLKENLETAYAKEKELATEVALFKALREKAEFDIPEKAIEMNVRQDLMNMARQFGIPPEQMMSLMGTLPLDKNREVTKEKLANSLILTTIVKLENINPTTEELEAKWKEHSESSCKGDHKSDKHKADFLLDVAIQLGTEKANEMLLEANKITYVEKKLEAPAAEAVA
jgi:trigger factor